MRRKHFFCSIAVVAALIMEMCAGNGVGSISAMSVSQDETNIQQEMSVGYEVINYRPVYSVRNIHKGTIVGDGVRLRKKPSSTSTVLELMNKGESVYVDPQTSAESGKGKWTYIQRDKTGTWGWVSNDYILVL